MTDILTLVTPFFLVIGCGYLAGRIGLIEASALKSLNSYLLYFALPGMFISRLSDIDLAQAFDVRLLIAFAAGNFVIWLISTVIQRGVFIGPEPLVRQLQQCTGGSPQHFGAEGVNT